MRKSTSANHPAPNISSIVAISNSPIKIGDHSCCNELNRRNRHAPVAINIIPLNRRKKIRRRLMAAFSISPSRSAADEYTA